jgi:hypothetical protein
VPHLPEPTCRLHHLHGPVASSSLTIALLIRSSISSRSSRRPRTADMVAASFRRRSLECSPSVSLKSAHNAVASRRAAESSRMPGSWCLSTPMKTVRRGMVQLEHHETHKLSSASRALHHLPQGWDASFSSTASRQPGSFVAHELVPEPVEPRQGSPRRPRGGTSPQVLVADALHLTTQRESHPRREARQDRSRWPKRGTSLRRAMRDPVARIPTRVL